MQLEFKQKHISIEQFNPIELADFTVLTGVNGSGKSHLLGAIETNKVIITGMEQASIVLFNYETFKLDSEPAFNAQQLSNERESAWQYHNQTIKNPAQSWRSSLGEEYQNLKSSCEEGKKSFLSLQFDELQTYKQSFKKFFNNSNIKSNPQAQGIYSLAKKLPYSIDEIEHDDFIQKYKPFVFKNNFLPNQLGKIFWDYHEKYTKNSIREYENEKKGKEHQVLSEEEFISIHGEKPWILVNKILETFDTMQYRVNSPEEVGYFESFQLKLMHIEKENLEIQFDTLSSGEKILMALVASIYKSSSDGLFPDILLLDEVDSSLHPSMMKNMLKVIEDIFIKEGVKVILVSHSPTTIALAPDDSIYIMNKSGVNRIEKKNKKEALAILTEGFATLNDIEPTLSIEYNLSKTVLPILFTEGITDKIIIETAWKKLNPSTEMPFYIQDCFDASFLANLFRRGDDERDGIFKTYSDKKLIALFDFDTEGYNAWKGLAKFSINIETNPKKCLSKRNIENNAFALLLPVPNNSSIEKQVIKEENTTFEHKSILTIELLFYGHQELDNYFVEETIQGDGKIIQFKGKKRKFAIEIKDLDADKFNSFIPLFEKLNEIITTTQQDISNQ
ncbi:MAG: AAA family ATPase [Sulfurovaceae bacterium]